MLSGRCAALSTRDRSAQDLAKPDAPSDFANVGSRPKTEDLRQFAFAAVVPTETTNWRMAKQIRRQRSSEIREYVLRRAEGVCELTGEKAPFSKPDGQPYLEVHHIKKLSDGGLDHPVNCAAITPNVHREIHFGQNGKHLDEQLSQLIKHKEALLDNM
jgi:5-methylcytosine-specific restriction enzyme A